MLASDGGLVAVLDIDSDTAAMFDEIDEANLQRLNKYFQLSRKLL
jgi:putative methionine-R-sulfoxide reductase with GAF domain